MGGSAIGSASSATAASVAGSGPPVGLRANVRLDLATAARAVPAGRFLLPILALAIGLGFGLGRPGYVSVYSESLLFIGLAIAVGAFGRTTGALLVLAHAAGDMAHFLLITDATTGAQVSRETIIGRIVIEMVLWLVVVIVPTMARRIEALVEAWAGAGIGGRAIGAVAAGAVVALGTDLWSNVMPYLLRSAYRFSPPPFTLQPQLHPEQLSAAAGAAAIAVTLVLRRRAVEPAEIGPLVAGLPSRGIGGLLVRVVGYAALMLLLVGILSGPSDAAILAAGFLVGEIGAALASRAGGAVSRVPAWLIAGSGVVLTAAVALAVGGVADGAYPKGNGDSLFLPILIATAAAFAVARTIIGLARYGRGSVIPVVPAPAAVITGIMAGGLLVALVLPSVALADNCANLGDCGFSDRFLLVIAGFAAFFGAGAGAMSGGGGSGGDGGGGGGGGGGGKSQPKPKDQPPPPPPEDLY